MTRESAIFSAGVNQFLKFFVIREMINYFGAKLLEGIGGVPIRFSISFVARFFDNVEPSFTRKQVSNRCKNINVEAMFFLNE